MYSNPLSPGDPRTKATLLWLMAGVLAITGLYAAFTWTASQAQFALEETARGGSITEARLGKGTEALLGQTAAHLSKLLGGESAGGFPGFEPPDDDEQYREKIRNQTYSPEDANHWIKEINNFLRQIVNKNPNMSLEEILKQAGLSQSETQAFIESLQNAHSIARGYSQYGVNPATLKHLEALMEILGVIAW